MGAVSESLTLHQNPLERAQHLAAYRFGHWHRRAFAVAVVYRVGCSAYCRRACAGQYAVTLPLWAYAGAGALLTGAMAGWTVRDWKADSDALKAEEQAFTQYKAFTETLADQSLRYETLAQSLRAGERRDRETIREIYRDTQVPADCAVPAAGVRVLSEAVARANAAASGKPSGTLPDAP
jgi:hypothetical protein